MGRPTRAEVLQMGVQLRYACKYLQLRSRGSVEEESLTILDKIQFHYCN